MRNNRIFAIVTLALVLCAGAAFAADSDFTFDAATGTITAYSGFDTELVIPAAIGGKPVKAIGDDVFQNSDLTKITLPQGLITIGASAFRRNKLTSLTIPGSVTTIGYGAFEDNKLTDLVIPEGVTTIGDSAFNDNALVSISYPTTLRRTLFYWSVETVNLPANWNFINDNIGREMYYNYIANDRKAGTYTKSMTYTKKKADNFNYVETQFGEVITGYDGYNVPARIRIPAELDGLPVKAINGGFASKSIAALQLPESVTYIGSETFSYNALTSLTLPAGLTFIGKEAFNYCKISAITIPAGVTYIGESAFYKNELTALIIPANVIEIGYAAFSENKITSLAIPGSVKRINDNAFYDNPLTSLSFAEGVTYIGKAFLCQGFRNSSLKAVTLPASLSYINGLAFSGRLITVTIPAAIKRLNIVPVNAAEGCVFVLQGPLTVYEREATDYISSADNGMFLYDSQKCETNLKAGRYTYTTSTDYRRKAGWGYSAR